MRKDTKFSPCIRLSVRGSLETSLGLSIAEMVATVFFIMERALSMQRIWPTTSQQFPLPLSIFNYSLAFAPTMHNGNDASLYLFHNRFYGQFKLLSPWEALCYNLKTTTTTTTKKTTKGPEIFNQSLIVLKYDFILLEILSLQNFKEHFWKAGQQKLLHSNIIILCQWTFIWLSWHLWMHSYDWMCRMEC